MYYKVCYLYNITGPLIHTYTSITVPNYLPRYLLYSHLNLTNKKNNLEISSTIYSLVVNNVDN